MGAPRKWMKALLGLKKSDKLASPEEEQNSSGSTGKIWHLRQPSVEIVNNIRENELNQNVDIASEDASSQSVVDPASTPSISLQVQNAAQLQWDMREERATVDAKDANFQSASDPADSPFTSLQVKSASQLQQNMREEWAAIDTEDSCFQSVPYPTSSPSTSLQAQNVAQFEQNMRAELAATDAKDANFQSVPDLTSSPSTSLRVQNAAQLKQNMRQKLVATDAKDANFQSVPDLTSSPSTSTSLLVQNAAQLQQNMREEWAARHIQKAFRGFLLQNGAQVQQIMSEEAAAISIQTAFRGFLARRALRGLKGLVRLQSLVRGHAVRRQAAITLRCMQALVKVQARARARHVRVALENQTAQQKLLEQLELETQVKKIEDGWCDKAGSADEIQAKLLKRKEAAARREKAKAYALARQWQAKTRQQVTPAGFETDKINWGWNWLERWMAIRPWENLILDINLKEGMKILENESGDPADVLTTELISTQKKSVANIGKGKSGPRLSNNAREERAAPRSESCSHSSVKSVNARETLNRLVSSRSSKPVVKDSAKEAASGPNFSTRSLSNPRERSTLPDKHGIRRLSLPGVSHGVSPTRQLSQTAIRSTSTAPKPVISRNKSNGNGVKTSKPSRRISH